MATVIQPEWQRSYGEFEWHEGEQASREDSGKDKEKDILKGVLAGAAAGLLAGWVMVQFQKAWTGAEKRLHANQHVPDHREKKGKKAEEEDATVKTANIISKEVFSHRLTKKEKKIAGPAVHYAFAASMGALYGGLAEWEPATSAGWGMAFGGALFVGADEIAVPALGLSDLPLETPISKHVYGLVSHLLYGATLEGVRRGIRAGL